MKKWLGQVLLCGVLCATIPDEKNILVTEATDSYNTRTSSSLTVEEFVKVAVRNAVLNEYALGQQVKVAASATVTAKTYQSTINAAQEKLQADIGAIGIGW